MTHHTVRQTENDPNSPTRRNAISRPSRRAVVGTAAWATPAILVSAATPVFAASAQTPTLAFDGPYSVRGCVPVPTMTLTLTKDGRAPEPTSVVTVTLPTGFEWSDGSLGARALTTDAAGQIRITGVLAPLENIASATITAMSTTGAQATTTVSVTIPVTATILMQNLNEYGSPKGNPSTVATFEGPVTDIRTAQNAASTVAYLTTDNRLIAMNGTLLAHGVVTFATSVDYSGNRRVYWAEGTQAYNQIIGSAGAPLNSKALLFTAGAPIVRIVAAWNSASTVGFLDQAEVLYGQSGSVVATGVSSFSCQVSWDATRYFNYAKKSDSNSVISRQKVDANGKPSGAPTTLCTVPGTVIDMLATVNENSVGAFMTVDKVLYDMSGTSIASNVVTFAPMVPYSGSRLVYFSKSDGTIWQHNSDTGADTQLGVSKVGMIDTIRTASNDSSVAIFGSRTGRLFNASGQLIVSGVAAFDAQVGASANRSVIYSTYQGC